MSRIESRSQENDDLVLYDKLVEVTKKQLTMQKEYLKEKIIELEMNENENKIAWDKIVNFEQFCIVSNEIGLRQDDTICVMIF